MPELSKYKPSRRSGPPAKTAEKTDEQRQKTDIAFVVIVMIAYLFLAANYSRLVVYGVPLGSVANVASVHLAATNPDESAHVANALVYRSGHLPVFQKGSPNFEAHQPPLYYLLIAPFVNNSTVNEGVDYARRISILLGALTIWSAFACVRTLFPDNTTLVRGVPAFIGLLPMNISLCASINNDVLLNLLVILALWKMARIIKIATTRPGKRLNQASYFVGAILGVALLTKTSALVLVPAILILAWQLYRHKLANRPSATAVAAISIGLGFAIALPWWIRNTVLYGDPLAQHIFTTAFQNTATTQEMLRRWSPGQYATIDTIWTFESFWGVFDSMRLFLPARIYAVLGLISFASIVGLVKCRRDYKSELTVGQIVFVTTLATLLVFTLLAFARFNMAFFQAQGRYLFTAILPIAVFFVIGISELLPMKLRRSGWTEIAIDAVLLVLNLVSLKYLAEYISIGGSR